MSAQLLIINCRQDELTRERLGFHSALARRSKVIVSPVRRVTDTWVELREGSSIPVSEVSALLHLDPPDTSIPEGLPTTHLPTVWVHMDGATGVPWRSLWSRLFDVACVCGTDGTGFDEQGLYRLITQPYAARREWFADETTAREFDIGWAGSFGGAIYSKRRKLLPLLAARYRMNDWQNKISESKVASLYRRAKIVVNIQRDDFPRLYNVRCFEAFAAGALVCLEKPNDIAHAGFRDGIHYAGYHSDEELFEIIDFFLTHESARTSVAEAGQNLAKEQHTYDHRVAELLNVLGEVAQDKQRGGVQMSQAKKSYLYCHYYSKHLELYSAGFHLKSLFHSASPLTVPALAHCSRAAWHRWRSTPPGRLASA
jgi:hypothetical protein